MSGAHSCYTTQTCDFSKHPPRTHTQESVGLSQDSDNDIFSLYSNPLPKHTHTHCPSVSLRSTRVSMFCTQIENEMGSGVRMRNLSTFSGSSNETCWDDESPPPPHLVTARARDIYPGAKPKALTEEGPENKITQIDARIKKGWQRITMLSDTGKRICQML